MSVNKSYAVGDRRQLRNSGDNEAMWAAARSRRNVGQVTISRAPQPAHTACPQQYYKPLPQVVSGCEAWPLRFHIREHYSDLAA